MNNSEIIKDRNRPRTVLDVEKERKRENRSESSFVAYSHWMLSISPGLRAKDSEKSLNETERGRKDKEAYAGPPCALVK